MDIFWSTYKLKVLVDFTAIWYLVCMYFVVIWYIFPLWYVVPRKIWQRCFETTVSQNKTEAPNAICKSTFPPSMHSFTDLLKNVYFATKRS
jgi:hypothetical protein